MGYTNISPTQVTGKHRDPTDFVFSTLSAGGVAGTSMVTDGSSSVKTFTYTVPDGKVFHWYRTNFFMEDAGMDGAKFGGLASLTTGLRLAVVASDTTTCLVDFTESLASSGILSNGQFGLLAGTDVAIIEGAPIDTLNVRWTMEKAGGPMVLSAGQIIAAEVRDALAGINQFKTLIQGLVNDA